MTVYGGEETVWGTRNGGFFVSCTKCGWHSTVEVYAEKGYTADSPCAVLFRCSRCGNEHLED